MSLRQMISDDASVVFCNTSDFAEPVKYLPRVGTPRCISAVVFREAMAVVTEDAGETIIPVWEVHVANDCLAGISSKEINLQNDKIAFAPRDGLPEQNKTILQLETQDHGMLVLQCR